MSDMDSDCDDVFTEDSKSCSGDNKSVSGTEDDGRNVMNRKRRRGIIEKRRRDRINNSLSELRRLVPAAFEKQGSAKLEKAEILQMTVDHLRQLHSRGIDVFSLEPYKLITDYHGVGFRECASEVARYLAAFEGLDLQDPLRLRLMSHLQCFSAQREALTPQQPQVQPPWFAQLPSAAPAISPVLPTPQYPHQFQSRASSISDMSLYSSSSSADSRASSVGSPRASRNPSIPISPIALNASPYLAGFSRPPIIMSDSSSKSPSIKPYRPWGTELAY